MKIVEQADIDGNIVLDYDTVLSPRGLYGTIASAFPGIRRDEDGMIRGEYKDRGFAIRAKNITYLGNPHPLYKKRIQIADDLQDFYKSALEKQCIPLLLGVYTYKKNTLFCVFNIEDYVRKKAHNSSAHVYVDDLANATTDGFFSKEDCFGNRITVFDVRTVLPALEDLLNVSNRVDVALMETADSAAECDIVPDFTVDDSSYEIENIKQIVWEFFSSTKRHWDGIDCYKEMIADNYRKKFQPEWPGYYLEYEFENYINNNDLSDTVHFAQDKKKGGIDLDLFFPKIEMYGDLKAHSSSSKAVQGNDWDTVIDLIESPGKSNHIYYIVCEHDTEKDSEHNYCVTNFWNSAQGKKNLMSYAKRMKYCVDLTHIYILDINSGNKQYLKVFRQGLNSNGKPREPKIMIEHDDFQYFVIAEWLL